MLETSPAALTASLSRALGQGLGSSENFLSLLIENMPLMVSVKDARDLRFLRVNRAGEVLLGVNREELLGKSDYDLFPAAQAEGLMARDRAVLCGGILQEIEEEPVLTRYRGTRLLRTKKIPILSEVGDPMYLLGISEDVTEKKLAERERLHFVQEQAEILVREKEARRMAFLAEGSTLLSSSLDYRSGLTQMAQLAVPAVADWVAVILRQEGRQPTAAALVHRDPSKEAALRQMIHLFFYHADDPVGVREALYAGRSYFAPVLSEGSVEAGAGTADRLSALREVGCRSMVIVPIVSRGKVHGSICFAMADGVRRFRQDDLRMAEELGRRAGTAVDNALLYEAARQAADVRDNFLSIASHELKTPITSLKLQIQTTRRNLEAGAERMPTPARLREVLARSERQVNRVARLVDDLLDVSRIGAGKLNLVPERVNFGAMVREAVDRCREQAELAGCTLSFRENAEVHLCCDPSRIEQVLVNLLSNALKYGRGQPVEVVLSTKDGIAELLVRDHGMGIRPDRIGRIFERFERAEIHEGIAGLGLGLYIVRSIVEAHGGKISVESSVGKGSCFRLELPGILALRNECAG